MNIINDMLVDKCFLDNANARAVVPAYKEKTDSGNPITLTDSVENKSLGMKLYGWSKQVVTTGKNLINADEYYSQFKQSDGTYKGENTVINKIAIPLAHFVGKRIVISANIDFPSTIDTMQIRAAIGENNYYGDIVYPNTNKRSVLTVTVQTQNDNFWFTYGSGSGQVIISDIQVELGSTATSYEPYTGGMRSPSPEYPQEIVSAGQKLSTGKNLINADDYYSVYKQADGMYKVDDVKLNDIIIFFDSSMVGKTYTASCNLNCPNTVSSVVLEANIDGKKVLGNIIPTNKSGISKVTFTPKTARDSIKITYGSGRGDIIFSDFQIEAGSFATSYEPYTGGVPTLYQKGIEVNVRGKNLVDIYGYSANGMDNPEEKRVLKNAYGTTLNTTEKTDKLIVNQEILDGATATNYTSGYFCIGINRKLETGKDYIITFRINVIRNPLTVSDIFVSFNGIEFDEAKVIGDKVTVKTKYKEFGERQYIEVRNRGISLEISDFMITEVGETDDYVPYTEQSVKLYHILNAISVASGGNIMIGGQQYIADYVDVERGKLVKKLKSFTISDIKTVSTWGVNENADNITGFYFYTSENGLPKTNNDVMASTILQYVDGTLGGKNVGCAMSSDIHNNYAILSVPTNMLEDISSDENACASLVKICENTNAIFFYSMESPIETDLAPEEIETYKNLVTYAGTTIVENDSDCWMDVTYKAGTSGKSKNEALRWYFKNVMPLVE